MSYLLPLRLESLTDKQEDLINRCTSLSNVKLNEGLLERRGNVFGRCKSIMPSTVTMFDLKISMDSIP